METREQELARLVEEQRRDDTLRIRPESHGGDHGRPVLSLDAMQASGPTPRDPWEVVGGPAYGAETLSDDEYRDERDGLMRQVAMSGPCWVCGGEAFEADHLVPKRHGGADVRANLAPICPPCNKRRYEDERATGQVWASAYDLALRQGY